MDADVLLQAVGNKVRLTVLRTTFIRQLLNGWPISHSRLSTLSSHATESELLLVTTCREIWIIYLSHSDLWPLHHLGVDAGEGSFVGTQQWLWRPPAHDWWHREDPLWTEAACGAVHGLQARKVYKQEGTIPRKWWQIDAIKAINNFHYLLYFREGQVKLKIISFRSAWRRESFSSLTSSAPRLRSNLESGRKRTTFRWERNINYKA